VALDLKLQALKMPTRSLRNSVKSVPGAVAAYRAWLATKHAFQGLRYRAARTNRFKHKSYNAVLGAALRGQKSRTDISDHLGTLFFFATGSTPTLMVELGTRGGESTRALLAAAAVTGATLLSVDIEDCSRIKAPGDEHWHFVQADDIGFGKAGFAKWCREHALVPVIDLLFIDTSHQYEHTKQEIEVWSKLLADRGLMIFHDTNMGRAVYARNDGSLGYSWDNERGVIRAVEEFMGRQYDENSYFCDASDAFSVLHFPTCSGLTILQKRGNTGI
jgi:predicted O-methyltransferase YrrM